MTQREDLVEVLRSAPFGGGILDEMWFSEVIEEFAEYLVNAGAVLMPCKVGDTVWCISRIGGQKNLTVKSGPVREIYFTDGGMRPAIAVRGQCTGFWGERIFASKAEAEAALAEMAKQ